MREAWVEPRDFERARRRSALMGTGQCAQLNPPPRTADVVLAATDAPAAEVGRDVVHTPVASNVTPLAVAHDEGRARASLEAPVAG